MYMWLTGLLLYLCVTTDTDIGVLPAGAWSFGVLCLFVSVHDDIHMTISCRQLSPVASYGVCGCVRCAVVFSKHGRQLTCYQHCFLCALLCVCACEWILLSRWMLPDC
eukprot:GHVQ01011285.1.p1 GENE.GHVQ01011285.1~~GHVQ01011285.1.p1  ORF type:complete len:108 (-),score=10.97 GHVQ01011285.1:334-657(-)